MVGQVWTVSIFALFGALEVWFLPISPMNSAPNFVHPLARNFADFLRLLLACGDVAALGASVDVGRSAI